MSRNETPSKIQNSSNKIPGVEEKEEMDYLLEVMKSVESERKDTTNMKNYSRKPLNKIDSEISEREDFERMKKMFGNDDQNQTPSFLYDEEEGVSDYGTYELVKKLQESVEKNQVSLIMNCQNFSDYFKEEVKKSKDKLELSLVLYFKQLAKERMPNVYIRSIKHVFREYEMDPGVKRSLELFEKRPKKRQNTIPTSETGKSGEVLRFDEDIMKDVSSIIRQFVGGAYIVSIQLIHEFCEKIQKLMDTLKKLNEKITVLIENVEKLQDDIQDKRTTSKDELTKKTNILKILNEEYEMKKLQRKILQYQYERRKESYDEERKNFILELEEVKNKFKDGGSSNRNYGSLNADTDISEKDSREMIERKLWKRIERVKKEIEKERQLVKNEIEKRRRELDIVEQEKIEEYNRIRSEIIIEKSRIL